MSWVWHKERKKAARVDWDAPVAMPQEARLEHLYAWERRCRGYEAYPYPVALEPPFVRFAPLSSNSADSNTENTPYALPQPPGPERTFLLIRLPPEQKVSPPSANSLLSTFRTVAYPLSFEIVGSVADDNESEIAYQLSAGRHEAAEVLAAMQMSYPLGAVEAVPDVLRQRLQHLKEKSVGYQVVDFGLYHPVYQPLQQSSGAFFAADAQAGLLSALSQLQNSEVAGVQVLFAATRHDWSSSILRLVAEFDSSQLQNRTGHNGKRFAGNEQEQGARTKLASPLFACVIRVFAVSTQGDSRAFSLCQRLGGALAALSESGGNELVALDNAGYGSSGYSPEEHLRDVLERTSRRSGMLLSTHELAGLVHPPSEKLLHPSLLRLDLSEKSLPEHLLHAPGAKLGLHPYRGKAQPVVWPDAFRNRHAYLLGATRMGKSTLMLNLIVQDLQEGRGLCLIDPHGDLAKDVLERVPSERAEEVLYIDLSDREHPPALSLLEAHDEWEQRLLASDVLSILRRLFASSWGDRLEHILRHALLTLLSQPGQVQETHTLRDIRPLLSDKAYRQSVLQNVTDPDLLAFWKSEFPTYSASSFAPIYNKLGLLLSSPIVRNIVAQKQSRLPLSQLMARKKVLLVNLSSSLVGEDNAHFLGALLVSKLQIAAMQSLRQGKENRAPFTLYVDEFQNFVVSSFEKILSEAGKAGLSLVMANQFLEQLPTQLQAGILGNVGTMVSFRVSSDSGRLLEKELAGRFSQSDLVSLNRGQAVVRLGQAQDSARIETMPPPLVEEVSLAGEIVQRTREECCRARAEVEAELAEETLAREQGKQSQEEPVQGKPVKEKPAAKKATEEDPQEPQQVLQQKAREEKLGKSAGSHRKAKSRTQGRATPRARPRNVKLYKVAPDTVVSDATVLDAAVLDAAVPNTVEPSAQGAAMTATSNETVNAADDMADGVGVDDAEAGSLGIDDAAATVDDKRGEGVQSADADNGRERVKRRAEGRGEKRKTRREGRTSRTARKQQNLPQRQTQMSPTGRPFASAGIEAQTGETAKLAGETAKLSEPIEMVSEAAFHSDSHSEEAAPPATTTATATDSIAVEKAVEEAPEPQMFGLVDDFDDADSADAESADE